MRYRRERVELSDGDFIDLDWVDAEAGRKGYCVVALHGLEGSSEAPYIKTMLRAFSNDGYAAAGMNLRGCSGEPNRKLRSYHSGSSDDLKEVLDHLYPKFGSIFLVGFSLGGNIVLKHLGEEGRSLDGRLKGAAAFSVPCDLASSAEALKRRSNALYMRRFMAHLGKKVGEKAARFPGQVDGEAWKKMRTFGEFDDFYTAPLNGFEGAEDYWRRASSQPLLGRIARPALLLSALNDPFLPDACYPRAEAAASDWLHLETPKSGGHCGFPGVRGKRGYWIEERALRFFEDRGA